MLNDSYSLKDYMFDNGWSNGPGQYHVLIVPNLSRQQIRVNKRVRLVHIVFFSECA